MDIGTAKPSPEVLGKVRHHLIDIVKPSEEFDTARFVGTARDCIAEILQRGKVPLVVGGTPLYLKALSQGIFRGPGASAPIRARLTMEFLGKGPMEMHERLKAVDPVSAARLHPNDMRRIVRALEVFELTGEPISRFQTQFGTPAEWMNACFAGLSRPRDILYERINLRVEEMFKKGFIEEVEKIRSGTGFGKMSSQALGYREILDGLAEGAPMEQIIDLVKRNTRHMARKQLTWFRHMKDVQWIEMGRESSESAVQRLLEIYRSALRKP
jgi:tRNA dimethylallyltransferase